jgi:Tol biopolymer transport system component
MQNLLTQTKRRFRWRWLALLFAMIFLGVAAAWFGPRILSIKAGALMLRPTEGTLEPAMKQAVLQATGSMQARVVWSSSRSGNHEIYLMTLPDLSIYRLTNNDRVDYFPRFSPDGNQIVLARSQRPWVSERELEPWDVFLLSLVDGKERLLAQDANFPQWVDKGHVSFVRKGRAVVVIDVDNGHERVVYPPPGQPGEWTELSNAELSPRDPHRLVLTGRGGVEGVFLLDLQQKTQQLFGHGGTCEITWAPDASYVLWMQNQGEGGGRIMRSPLRPDQEEVFMDMPGEFSHEYFPRLSRDGRWLVFGASSGGHEHDLADYEIFLWQIGRPWSEAVRLTANPGNDRWPDIFIQK